MGRKEETVATSLRLPKSLLAQVDAYAEGRELSRTAAVTSLLRKALAPVGDPDQQPMTKADYHALQSRIATGLAAVTKAVQEQPVQIAKALPTPEDTEAARAEAAAQERERIRGLGLLARIKGDF